MLEQDRDTLIEYSTDFSKELKNQYSFLGAWRGDGWSRMLKDCTFSEGAHKLVDSVIKIRTHYMMMQATQWGPEMERINAYAARAQALLVAARKNAGSGGAGAEEFEKMRAALDDAWFAPGSKSGASTLAGKMSSQLSNAKQKIKAGKVDSGLTSHQQDTFDSTLAMGKTLRGAVKSLDILGKSVADMVKGSAKDKELGPKWVDLAKKIKTAQGEAAQAVKDHEEYEKILPKLVKLYKDYDAKKK